MRGPSGRREKGEATDPLLVDILPIMYLRDFFSTKERDLDKYTRKEPHHFIFKSKILGRRGQGRKDTPRKYFRPTS